MVIGKPILTENGVSVVTETVNGEVTNTELLQDYVAKITVIEYQGEHRTIKDVLEQRCEEYLKRSTVVF